MDIAYAHTSSQRVLRQRNLLALAVVVLTIVTGLLTLGFAGRNREVVLQPILKSPLTISSAGVSREYLEAVTRDAAYLTLNRTPQSLDYWMNAVLDMVHPSAYGRVKADLLKIVDDQRGSSIAQYFTIESMKVDPEMLTSDVNGVVHTMVGKQEVSSSAKTFRFRWIYTGISLRLIQFGMIEKADGNKEAAE